MVEEIPNKDEEKRKKEKKLIFTIGGGYILVLILVFALIILPTLEDLLGINLIVELILLTIFVGLSLFFVFVIHKAYQKNFKFWVSLTIYLSIFTLFVGIIFIGLVIQKPNLSSVLYNQKTGQVFQNAISCQSQSGYYLINDVITCKIKNPFLNSYKANITFYEGSTVINKINLVNNLQFEANNKSNGILFEINGVDKEGNQAYYTVFRKFSFLTEDQKDSLKDKIVSYILGLFAITLFSIPIFVKNIRDLYHNK